MSIVKTETRNRMLLPMLTAFMFVRIHMKVTGVFCTSYPPSEYKLKIFNSKMYEGLKKNTDVILYCLSNDTVVLIQNFLLTNHKKF